MKYLVFLDTYKKIRDIIKTIIFIIKRYVNLIISQLIENTLGASEHVRLQITKLIILTLNENIINQHLIKNVLVNIFLDESVLIEKLAARRTCVGCGKSYNLVDIHRNGYDMYPLLPKVAVKCDKCGDKLITRPDDEESVIKNRLVEYYQKTFPLLDIYRKKDCCLILNPKKECKITLDSQKLQNLQQRNDSIIFE